MSENYQGKPLLAVLHMEFGLINDDFGHFEQAKYSNQKCDPLIQGCQYFLGGQLSDYK